MDVSTATYRRNPLTAGRIVDGQAFVITPDNNKLHSLNATATHLWVAAASGLTLPQAATALCDEFDVTFDTALADAARCMDDLVARGILVALA
ncbi:MAG: PqqD family protein [Myxococcales bacterium]|nr:PqqD family protein [Myxococcales bacterium]